MVKGAFVIDRHRSFFLLVFGAAVSALVLIIFASVYHAVRIRIKRAFAAGQVAGVREYLHANKNGAPTD